MSEIKQAVPGHFYAVGVGPGEPDLITIRASRIIESADVLIAPKSSTVQIYHVQDSCEI